MAAAKRRFCKDCLAEIGPTKTRLAGRDAKFVGPRCFSHHHARKRATRKASHGSYVLRTYGITEEQYWALYDFQGGRCYICRRATGKTKRLAVDHDHSCCPETPACGRCIRGLLDRNCNRDVVGHLRDDPEAFDRGAEYLRNPPARAVLYGP